MENGKRKIQNVEGGVIQRFAFSLDQLFTLFSKGGVDIVTLIPKDKHGRPAFRTVIQPDGDIIFYIADPRLVKMESDLWQDHTQKSTRAIQYLGGLRALARGGTMAANIAGAGFAFQSGLDCFLWGEPQAALFSLVKAAAPLMVKAAAGFFFIRLLRRRFKKQLNM